MKSLLADVRPEDLRLDPYPHVVATDVLDPEFCRQLIDELPPLEAVTGRVRNSSNRRVSVSARNALCRPDVTAMWQAFVRTHTSQAWLDQVTSLLAPAIRTEYPEFEDQFGPIDSLRAGVRYEDDFRNADVLLDAQICVNTPVLSRTTSVRRGHVDLREKLFVGLFYLRSPDDDSSGGDFEIYRFRGSEIGFHGKYIDDRYLEVADTVKYDNNVFVLFLNSHRALHGVTPRGRTDSSRWFLNVVGEVREPLFDLRSRQMRWSPARRVMRVGEKIVRGVSHVLERR